MNEDQQFALDLMNEGKNVFLTGPGGVGKSYVIKKFVESTCKKVAVTSTTGVSAILIGGVTLHSWAGIGLGKGEFRKLMAIIRKNRALDRWLKTDVLIVDEISMIDFKFLELLEKIAHETRGNSKPFGGMQLIFSGDWAQLGPVNSSTFLFENEIWDYLDLTTVYLTKVLRQQDKVFIDILNKVRLGECDEMSRKILMSTKDNQIEKNGVLPTRLYSHNVDVDFINNENLEVLAKKHKVFTYSAVYDKYFTGIEKYFQNVPDTLKLTKDCQVIITYNINTAAGIVNGSRGIIDYCDEKNIHVKLIDGRIISIDIHPWEIDLGELFHSPAGYVYTKSQYPLKLAYALTIHKSQGSTIDCLEIDIGNKIFCHGQTYTALSRASSLEGLRIVDFNPKKIICKPQVKSFYTEIEKI